MTPFDEERNALRYAIARAFEGVPYPGDDAVLAADCIDEMDVEHFYGRSWETGWNALSAELIERHYDSLSFLSPSAYQFFLPAYLTYAVSAFDDETSLVLYWLLFDLDPESLPTELRNRSYVQKEALTGQQRQVVAEFLTFVARRTAHDELRTRAQRALERCWRPQERGHH